MHVHSSPPNSDAWQATTPSRTGPAAAQINGTSPGASPIGDFAAELSGAGTTTSPSASSNGNSASSPSLSSLSPGLQSLLTNLQAVGSQPRGTPASSTPTPSSTPATSSASGADVASPVSQLSAMLQSYQSNGYAQTGSGAANATDFSV